MRIALASEHVAIEIEVWRSLTVSGSGRPYSVPRVMYNGMMMRRISDSTLRTDPLEQSSNLICVNVREWMCLGRDN